MNKANSNSVNKPWLKFYGEVPASLEYPSYTLYDSIKKITNKYPDYFAHIFMGKKTTYKKFFNEINQCAKSLKNYGIKEGDIVSIIMPNCPQALVMFYAVNCVGAVSNMIHPLSSEKEIEYYFNLTNSKLAITLDVFLNKVEAAFTKSNVDMLVVASIGDALDYAKRIGYKFSTRRKIEHFSENEKRISWKSFLKAGHSFNGNYNVSRNANDDAVILYSGGTTGTQKGIRLSNYSINVIAVQLFAINPKSKAGDAVFSGMPIFHGFGLAMTCHGVLFHGGTCVLVPRFNAKSVLNLIIKYKCTIIAGVPTLFEAILRATKGKKYNLSFIKAVFCGGDALSESLEKRFNSFLIKSNCKEKIRVGYGLTECVTAVTVSIYEQKPGSNGVPLPDMLIKICIPGTQNEVPYGQTGEICIHGPSVMNGYLNNDEETDIALQKHNDGRIWLHTGDLGYLDEDGFLFFVQRLKRMIISSGYNVYPSQLERVYENHEFVDLCCVIGLPDSYKGQKVKAYIKLKEGINNNDETKNCLLDYGKIHIAKYALPSDIEFRDELPRTLIGKVDYKALENEELAKL